jgi:hypothetical protein
MRRRTRRKGTSKRVSRSYKRTCKQSSKGTSKRVARKQSGGKIDMVKLQEVIKQRLRASNLAAISAKKAEEFKKQAESL